MRQMLMVSFAIAAMLLGMGCDKYDGHQPEETVGEEISLTKSQAAVLDASRDFSFDLLRNLVTNVNSVFISPFSLQAAMSMAANGSSGETYSEISSAIGYKDFSIEDINSLYAVLVEALLNADESTKLKIANSIWINDGFPVNGDYVSGLHENYKTECRNLNLRNLEAVGEINSWCSSKTDNVIPEIIQEIDPSTEMILMNALYFKGIWVHSFDPSNTCEMNFRALSGENRIVEMMNQTNKFFYNENEEAQYLAMPFGSKAFELVILLPKEGVDFKAYLAGLDYKKFEELSSKSTEKELDVSVPKISIDYQADLIPVLQKMGITKAFTCSAEFPHISTVPLYIGSVLQRAVFKMDETGSEAAGTTFIGFNKACINPRFIANSPFIFAIRESTTSAILFIGTYTGV